MTPPDARRERVLVTGVTGRIGINLARRLTAEGYLVRGMVIPADPALPRLAGLDGIEVAEAELTDSAAIRGAVADVDVVVHLAAQMRVGDTPIDKLIDINTVGTVRLLDAAARSDHRVRRFVFVSTDGTYGPTDPRYLPLDEDHPQRPGDYYGLSKVLAERAVENYSIHYDLPYTIVRYGSVLAPDEVLTRFRYEAAAALLSLAAAGRSSQVWKLFVGATSPVDALKRQVPDPTGNPAVALTDDLGNPWMIHFTDVRDAVDGTVAAITHPAAAGQAFNIVGPMPVTWAEGAAIVADALGLPSVPVSMPFRFYFHVSAEKARRVMGWEPQWTFARMVESALRMEQGEDVGAIPVAMPGPTRP